MRHIGSTEPFEEHAHRAIIAPCHPRAVSRAALSTRELLDISMVARRHHFLPQCYLKGFSKPRKRGKTHHVVVFDRQGERFTSNILNIAVKHDFNRVEIEGNAPDVFEQEMAKFEGELAPALNRILEVRNLRSAEDRAILLTSLG